MIFTKLKKDIGEVTFLGRAREPGLTATGKD
jgi:hypothetical protein